MLDRVRRFLTPQAVLLPLCVAAAATTLWAGARWITTARADSRLEAVVAELSPASPAEAGAQAAEGVDADTAPPTPPDMPPGIAMMMHGGHMGGGGPAPRPDDPVGRAVVQRIMERYVFSQPPPQRFRSIKGVLGDRVIFADGAAMAVGDQYDGATIKAIGGDWVELEHQGRQVIVGVRGGQGSYADANGSSDTAAGSPPRAGDPADRPRNRDGRRAGGAGRRFEMPPGMTPQQMREMFERRRAERRGERARPAATEPVESDDESESESDGR